MSASPGNAGGLTEKRVPFGLGRVLFLRGSRRSRVGVVEAGWRGRGDVLGVVRYEFVAVAYLI